LRAVIGVPTKGTHSVEVAVEQNLLQVDAIPSHERQIRRGFETHGGLATAASVLTNMTVSSANIVKSLKLNPANARKMLSQSHENLHVSSMKAVKPKPEKCQTKTASPTPVNC
jgi:hypothetical protein